MTILEQIGILKPKLELLIEKNHEKINQISENLKKLMESSSTFDHSWAGQWGSYNFNYYYDINSKLKEVIILSADNIQEIIESAAGVKIVTLKDEIYPIIDENIKFKDELITELSIIKGDENLTAECELLQKIEEHTWGLSPDDYVKSRRPSHIYTNNPAAIMNRGVIETPPHLSVGGELISILTTIVALENLHKNSKRILRQLELKCEGSKTAKGTILNVDLLYSVFERFHIVANQLKQRHSGRPTLIISDEYDVQDLLHSLLKLHYDDIRSEEYTPSYAGSATRIDFLIKKEKILIEVKKTRENLKDKEIGDQLILDNQHYKAHPDCRHLICFVYDPENRISNPRGLEFDLNKISDEQLTVEVLIRP